MGWTTMAMPREGARAYLDTLYGWSDEHQLSEPLTGAVFDLSGGRSTY